MEQTKVPIVAKRIYNMVRVIYYMLRKGISKRKLTVDLIMMLKRGKIAGKAAINNLMFHHHHHHHHSSVVFSRHSHDDYEFSCSNSPVSSFPFNLTKRNKRKNNNNHSHSFACADTSGTEDDILTASGVRKVLEMLNGEMASPMLPGFGQSPTVRQLRITDSPFPLRDVGEVDGHVELEMLNGEMASPMLPGFGQSPTVRQLRITDSPFPLRDVGEVDGHVDDAAENFIIRFYNDLRKENAMAES